MLFFKGSFNCHVPYMLDTAFGQFMYFVFLFRLGELVYELQVVAVVVRLWHTCVVHLDLNLY